MSPYLLQCSVCEDTFNRSDDWTKHLFGNNHQAKARLECAQWEDTSKECALVAFFSDPITSAVSKDENASGGEPNLILMMRNLLLMNLSGDEEAFCGPLLITDFVWWSEIPKMCILQFESRKKLDEVYSKLIRDENGVQKIHNMGSYLVQFKKLMDLLELEWRMLIPDSAQMIQKRPCTTTTSEEESSPQKKRRQNIPNAFEQAIIPTPNGQDLTVQYNDIIKSSQIPSQISTKADYITQKIKTIVCLTYPKCETYLLRSYNLKIKNRQYDDQSDLLIFVHGGSSFKKSSRKLKIYELVNLLIHSEQIPGLKISSSKPITKELDLEGKAGQRFELVHDDYSSTSGFLVFTDLVFGIEAQLGRLLRYMCQFDLRCHPVIALMHYFCTTNSCYFDDPQWHGDPMEWLVILFMSKKKYIPTVRQVLDQDHDPVWQTSEKRIIDIGFNDNDQKFLQNWSKSPETINKLEDKKQIAHCVLKLFQEFLSFLGNILGYENQILNVRDGEILNRKLMFSKVPGEDSIKTKLTEEKISVIKMSPCHLARWGKWPFSIVHPLVVNLKLGFQVERIGVAVKLMSFGGKQLEKFFKDITEKVEISSGKSESILKIDDVTRELILNERLTWQGKRTKL